MLLDPRLEIFCRIDNAAHASFCCDYEVIWNRLFVPLQQPIKLRPVEFASVLGDLGTILFIARTSTIKSIL